MKAEDLVIGKEYKVINCDGHRFKEREVIEFVKIDLDGDFVFEKNGLSQVINPEDVTPYIEPKEEVSDRNDCLETAARKQYENVGYDIDTDGTMSLYISGSNFGANWQKEQTKALQLSHDKLLEALENILLWAKVKDGQFTYTNTDPNFKDKTTELIKNAKNYAKK